MAKDHNRILALIPIPLLLVGAACAVLGLVEIYCFYLFSDGGPFYYLSFPPTEMEAFQGVPLQGIHFVPLIGLPLLLTMGVIIHSKRHLGRIRQPLL